MKKPIGIIYVTTNLINNKKYIGQHLGFDKTYLGSGTILKLAIIKYGKENFKRETLMECFSLEDMNNKEKILISLYKATSSPLFYNIHEGGSGGNTMLGWSDLRRKEFIEKMKIINQTESNGMYGKKHSLKTREALRQIRLQQPTSTSPYKTSEFRQKMSEVTKGENNGMYSKNHSSESKRLMSEHRTGQCVGNENGNYGNIGNMAKNGKPIERFVDSDFTILDKTYNTVTQALDELSLKGHSALYKAIKNKTKYKNYYWRKESKV